MKRLPNAIIAVLACFLASGACSDSTVSGPYGDIAGTYALQTVNGAPLPYTFSDQSTSTVELTSASITLKADGSFSTQTTLHTTSGTTSYSNVHPSSGNFSRNNTLIAANYIDGAHETWTWVGNTITATSIDAGTPLTLVFTR
jgi:hypothetical protein